MRIISGIVIMAFVLLFAGSLQQQFGGGNETASGSANFQRCMSQCGPGNAGNGTLCRDGCRVQEAEDTKSTSLCDALEDKANRPSCYGTVAKASGNLSVCNQFSNTTEKNYCVSVFGSPGTS